MPTRGATRGSCSSCRCCATPRPPHLLRPRVCTRGASRPSATGTGRHTRGPRWSSPGPRPTSLGPGYKSRESRRWLTSAPPAPRTCNGDASQGPERAVASRGHGAPLRSGRAAARMLVAIHTRPPHCEKAVPSMGTSTGEITVVRWQLSPRIGRLPQDRGSSLVPVRSRSYRRYGSGALARVGVASPPSPDGWGWASFRRVGHPAAGSGR